MTKLWWVDADGNDRETTVADDERDDAVAFIEESGGWVDEELTLR